VNIGIVGSGRIGGALARRLTTLGHHVTVANSRGPESLAVLAEETGATAGTVADAAGAELVVIAIPVRAVPDLPADAFAGTVVVDANNYYVGRDGDIPEIAGGRVTSSRWTADRLAGARVVKAFNTIHALHLFGYGQPSGTLGRIALPVAADDEEAKRLVMSIVDELGFEPVDAGSLDESWRQEPDTPVYGADWDASGVRAGLATATRP